MNDAPQPRTVELTDAELVILNNALNESSAGISYQPFYGKYATTGQSPGGGEFEAQPEAEPKPKPGHGQGKGRGGGPGAGKGTPPGKAKGGPPSPGGGPTVQRTGGAGA